MVHPSSFATEFQEFKWNSRKRFMDGKSRRNCSFAVWKTPLPWKSGRVLAPISTTVSNLAPDGSSRKVKKCTCFAQTTGWFMATKTQGSKIQQCLQRTVICKFVNIRWPDRIANKKPMVGNWPRLEQLRRRRRNWLGSRLRRDYGAIAKQAIEWKNWKPCGCREGDWRILGERDREKTCGQQALGTAGGGSTRQNWLDTNGLWPGLNWKQQSTSRL